VIKNVMRLPAFASGGQLGVIAQDWRLRRAVAQEGTPLLKDLCFDIIFFTTASFLRNSLFLLITCNEDAFFPEEFCFINYFSPRFFFENKSMNYE